MFGWFGRRRQKFTYTQAYAPLLGGARTLQGAPDVASLAKCAPFMSGVRLIARAVASCQISTASPRYGRLFRQLNPQVPNTRLFGDLATRMTVDGEAFMRLHRSNGRVIYVTLPDTLVQRIDTDTGLKTYQLGGVVIPSEDIVEFQTPFRLSASLFSAVKVWNAIQSHRLNALGGSVVSAFLATPKDGMQRPTAEQMQEFVTAAQQAMEQGSIIAADGFDLRGLDLPPFLQNPLEALAEQQLNIIAAGLGVTPMQIGGQGAVTYSNLGQLLAAQYHSAFRPTLQEIATPLEHRFGIVLDIKDDHLTTGSLQSSAEVVTRLMQAGVITARESRRLLDWDADESMIRNPEELDTLQRGGSQTLEGDRVGEMPSGGTPGDMPAAAKLRMVQ